MIFTYTNSLRITEDDLNYIATLCAEGETFEAAVSCILDYLDDDDWYALNYIEDQLRAEIERRVNITKKRFGRLSCYNA